MDIRLLFKEAIDYRATAIIIVHNHPSGRKDPSQADLDLTDRIFHLGRTLEIRLLDHLIIAENGYYSFADEGDLIKD